MVVAIIYTKFTLTYKSDLNNDSPEELKEVAFTEGFSGITGLGTGPDGYLYILSYGKGAI